MFGERIRFEREINDLGLAQVLTREFDQAQPSAAAQTLAAMIGRGEPENAITNELFYLRHPKLRGKSITDSKLTSEWGSLRDRRVRPAVKAQLATWSVDPLQLAAFMSQYENDAWVPAEASQQFLNRGAMLSAGKSLRDALLWQWRSNKPPAKVADLLRLARLLADHPGAVMLLCHNVTKALARGFSPITWDRDKSSPGTYSDGVKTWQAALHHKDGQLNYKGKPSFFYLLFSNKEFGTSDPGDWYHYFVAATFTAFDAAGAFTPAAGSRGRTRELERDDPNRVVSSSDYAGILADRLADLKAQMTYGEPGGPPGYTGWTYANCVSFLEGGYYGKSQSEVDRESRFHLRGAIAGLRSGNLRPEGKWAWYVPVADSLTRVDLATGFSLQSKTRETLSAADFVK